ncbi:MAG TPA: hypothetical protein PLJ21_12640 [Pseudobdellovibrionaceae bacterium]|nr:hypothetical protein [Pseudobdellovibrionaceae bacterium]
MNDFILTLKRIPQKSLLLVITFLLSIPSVGAAKDKVETMCRIKAKEIALNTYSSCVTENKNKKIEKIRDSYKKELQGLKNKYDKALKNISGDEERLKSNTKNPIKEETLANENLDADEVIEVEEVY